MVKCFIDIDFSFRKFKNHCISKLTDFIVRFLLRKTLRNLIQKTSILVQFQVQFFYQNPSKKVADVDFSTMFIFFWVIFRLTHFKVTIFLLTQTMRLNGCLKEKINVIRPLEKFLSDFEKKVSTLFEPKNLVNPENFSAKFLFKISLKNFFDKNFWLQMPLKNFWSTFWIRFEYEKCALRSELSNARKIKLIRHV